MQGDDVILRSSDLVSFRVHNSILAVSSPFFVDMFSLLEPLDGEVIGGLPVVHRLEHTYGRVVHLPNILKGRWS